MWYQYAATTDDDAPFAIYDAEFADLGGFAYDVPRFLSEDAFARANVDERPPWRWLLLGGPRSGTGVHVDPLYTHAWVYLVQGLKRWIFLPSHLSRDELRALGVGEPQLPSAQWFARYRDKAAALPGTVELVQRPGELVYVPAGRPHAVLNLEWSYALTHNYAVLSDACVLSTSMEEPEFFDALRGTLPSSKARPIVRASVRRGRVGTAGRGRSCCCGVVVYFAPSVDDGVYASARHRRGIFAAASEAMDGDASCRRRRRSHRSPFILSIAGAASPSRGPCAPNPRTASARACARRASGRPTLAHGRVDEHVLHVVVVVIYFGVDGDARLRCWRRRVVARCRPAAAALDFGRRSAAVAGIGLTTGSAPRTCPQESQRNAQHGSACAQWVWCALRGLLATCVGHGVLWSQDMCQTSICLPSTSQIVSNTTKGQQLPAGSASRASLCRGRC